MALPLSKLLGPGERAIVNPNRGDEVFTRAEFEVFAKLSRHEQAEILRLPVGLAIARLAGDMERTAAPERALRLSDKATTTKDQNP